MVDELQQNPAKRIFKRTLLHLFFCLAALSFFAFGYYEDLPALVIPIWLTAFFLFVCGLLANKAQKKAGFLSYEACIDLYRASNSRAEINLILFIFIVLMAILLGFFVSTITATFSDFLDILDNLIFLMTAIVVASAVFILVIYLIINVLVSKSLSTTPKPEHTNRIFIFEQQYPQGILGSYFSFYMYAFPFTWL